MENRIANTGYRADIDGLRAIAVLSVIIFHAFPKALPGGFLGVDIFFVISGFLITRSIAYQCERAQFSFLDFYRRRIRRIYPALILVMIFTAIAGPVVFWGNETQSLSWHIFGATLFLPNFFLWHEAGYFDADAQTKPLLHLWSLGIEEQFYIVWPLLVWFSFRRKWPLARILGLVTGLSFAFCIYLSYTDPTAAFYSPLSRAWELSFGGLVSLRRDEENEPKDVMAAAGIIAIAASLILAKEASFSVWSAIFPVSGAGLLIAAGPGSKLSLRGLTARPIVAIGLISYPLYLWHWPLLVLRRINDTSVSVRSTLIIVALSFVLAALTFLFLERPLHRVASLRRTSSYLLGGMVVLCAVGFTGSRLDMRSFWYPPDVIPVLDYLQYDFTTDARVGECWLDPKETKEQSFSASCGFPPDRHGTRIALWGDSHAGRLYPGLRLAADPGIGIAEYVANACPPIEDYKECGTINGKALSALSGQKPDVVVLFAIWSRYSAQYQIGPVVDGLNATIDKLQSNGAEVVIAGPFPDFKGSLPKLVLKKWSEDKARGLPSRIGGLPDKKTIAVENDLKALAAKRQLKYFSLVDLLCNGAGCATAYSSDPSDLITWDYGHLTTGGAQYVGKALLDEMIVSRAAAK